MIRLRQIPWGLLGALMALKRVSAVPSVDVSMRAAFSAAPYLLELLETAAAENSTSYFPLLDRVASGYFDAYSTDKELYEKFLAVLVDDGHLAQPEALSTFKLALSMRSAAPRIEAHYQYYTTGVEPKLEATADGGCEAWVMFNDAQHCSTTLAEPRGEAIPGVQTKPLPFDRVLGSGPAAILYADILSPSFGQFHKTLATKARNGELSYRLRYRRHSGASAEAVPVSGYGVELALKKTDYIVIDDRESEPVVAQKTTDQVVLGGEEEVTDLKPLSKAELRDLGLKTSSFIMKSEDPFKTLLQVSQDFPKYSAQMVGHNASKDFIEEHETKLEMVPSGYNVLWMNGVQLIERQIEPYTLVDLLRRERKLIDAVKKLGLSGKQAIALLGHSNVTQAKVEDEPLRFDWRDDLEGNKVILWLNNIEKDDRYEDWPDTVGAVLQRTYPGQIPAVRRDMFNLIVPLDFSNMDDVKVAAQLDVFVQRLIAIRFGFVPLVSTPESSDIAKILYYLYTNYGLDGFRAYLDVVMGEEAIPANADAFAKAVEDGTLLEGGKALAFDQVLESEDISHQIELAKHWADRLKTTADKPTAFANGLAIPRDENWLQSMSMRIAGDLQSLQEAVYTKELEDDAWLPSFFLKRAVAKRNIYVYPEDEKALGMIDISVLYSAHEKLFTNIPVFDAYAESSKENWAVLTVLADLDTEEGLNLLLPALQFRRNNPGVRLEVVHNPQPGTSGAPVSHALLKNKASLGEADTLDEIRSCMAADADPNSFIDHGLDAFLDFIEIARGSQALILNGRVVGPISAENPFDEADIQMLLEVEQKERILPVYHAVDDLGLVKTLSGPLAAAKLTSLVALSTISDLPEGIFEQAPTLRTSIFDMWESKHTAIEVGNDETASIRIVGLLNPASEQGQRWLPILKVLSELDGVYLKLFLNPRERMEELPVKRFYRYVLNSEPTFDDAGKVKALGAHFSGVPSEALLTVGLNVPPAWLVAPKISVHDLDNIRLSSAKGSIEAVYELENILIEGHSRIPEDKKAPTPRGAQLVLGTEKDPHAADTIIMANLGFFQFKANPGFYNIQLQEGRTSDIFSIESVGAQGYKAVPGDEGTDVVLMDFQGTTLYPRLNRKPGMETADVLSDGAEDQDKQEAGGNILSKGLKFAEGLWGGSGSGKADVTTSISAEEHAEINIFSVASGHLYERMLNIMMVSVMRHTKHTVKFWFIEQFLSPSFKEFIPHLAKEYGFKYEMVTYKWPHWLRQQKEKQREIWGYKILFLDVLFPLSLDKVIFVDADQIVRTDMMDLVNFDLEDAPYGFTPMGDSRTEMEGYRFWKQGYWANYLRGLPYHISALYVVDLRRFRELAAGDRLRQQYHSLSADPNSLANLDQDLPNHMQFVIPIKSLPQEWLWCETWCSDESLAAAKTIDLCNNPMTKEPKLDRARRQVPEWTVYDDEIAEVERRTRGLRRGKGQEVSIQEEEQRREEREQKEKRERERAEEAKGGDGEETAKNTKSRKMEEPVSSEKDEL